MDEIETNRRQATKKGTEFLPRIAESVARERERERAIAIIEQAKTHIKLTTVKTIQ